MSIRTEKRQFLPFEEAREYVQGLGLKSQMEWRAYCQAGQKPSNIPCWPDQVYHKHWKGWGDWVGTGFVPTQKRVFLPFEEARAYVQSLGLKGSRDWFVYCKLGKRPQNIPSSPDHVYSQNWKGWGDWLGTASGWTRNPARQKFLPFEEARAYVQNLGLKNKLEWAVYCTSGEKPVNIPSSPEGVYKGQYQGLRDWLGLSPCQWLSFEEARDYARQLGLKGESQWRVYCKSGQKPPNIPSCPHKVYHKHWKGWGDWLEIGTIWTQPTLLALLHDIRSRFAHLTEPELFALLSKNGSLSAFRMAQGHASIKHVLTDLKDNGGQQIEDKLAQCSNDVSVVVSTDTVEPSQNNDEILPDEEFLAPDTSDIQHEGPKGLPQRPVERKHLLDIDLLLNDLPGGVDDETAEYLVMNRVALLWEQYIEDGGRERVDKLLAQDGGHWFQEIKRRFLAELDGVEQLPIPAGWAFTTQAGVRAWPNIMQRRVAWMVREKQRVGNWSGVGSGKTASAVLASRVINARVTLVIVTNATVDQWRREVKNAYPDSIVLTHVDERTAIDRSYHTYIVLNYDKFQSHTNRNILVYQLLALDLDFIILDEVQLVKQRDMQESYRRSMVSSLVCAAEQRNPALCVLGMSATPVINHLIEAKKLLEIVTGYDFHELKTKPTVPNALAMHRMLMLHGVRYRPPYNVEMPPILVKSVRNDLREELVRASGSLLGMEQALISAKLEAVREHFKKGTLVYTHYVEEIVPVIRVYLERLGFTVGLYTATDTSGLHLFLKKKVDILLGTRPVGTGINGLQTVCNRLVFLSLPWTNAEYEQIVGRIRRQGTLFSSVDIIIPQIMLQEDGEEWSWDVWRLSHIQDKRTLTDCVVDGRIPTTIHINQKVLLDHAREALEKWIARVEEEGPFAFERARLRIPLPPDIRLVAEKRHGSFSTISRRWMASLSQTTHDRLVEDPSEWYLYHTLYREAREQWHEQPYAQIAERLRVRTDWLVGDFGCGECLLQQALPMHRMKSIDHVACNEQVIVCNMAHTPLEDASLDAAVFSLSLIGTNWIEYLAEAYRTLKPYGHLFVAEPVARWTNRQEELQDALRAQGFFLVGSIEQRYDFLYLTALKMQ